MSIRLRVVDGCLVAICGARSIAKEGDVYLDDRCPHALTIKFASDFASERGETYPPGECELLLMDQEESNNPGRDWWDSNFGT